MPHSVWKLCFQTDAQIFGGGQIYGRIAEGQSTGFLQRTRKPTNKTKNILWRINIMAFFNSAVGVLQTLVVALGAGLGIWGAINLMEGYGNDNPGSKSQGMKQLMAGGGVALIGITLVPLLSGLF